MNKHFNANRALIRSINRTLVLNAIKNHGPISRTDIVKLTGLSPASLSNISAELIESGLVFEKESGESSGGRKPVYLALNPHGGFVIGIKLAEKQISATLTDLEATVICNKSREIHSKDSQKVLDDIAEVVQTIIDEQNVKPDKLLGIGLGLAGIINNHEGTLLYSPFFGWHDLPIGEILESKLGVPVYLDNDVNTLTITESLFGAGKGIENFLVVTVGRGIGLGIVIGGQIYHGYQGGAGEFGHTVCDENGPLCDCGKHGCLETFVADPALINAANTVLQDPVSSVDEMIDLAEQGHKEIEVIFTNAGQKLGQGIANLINLFNPQLIIVSGEGVRSGDLLFKPMKETIEKYSIQCLGKGTEILIDKWEDFAWARGAASLVLQELFKLPIKANE